MPFSYIIALHLWPVRLCHIYYSLSVERITRTNKTVSVENDKTQEKKDRREKRKEKDREK